MNLSRTQLWSTCLLLAGTNFASASDRVMQVHAIMTPPPSVTPATQTAGQVSPAAAFSPLATQPEKIAEAPLNSPVFVPLVRENSFDGWVVQEGKASSWKINGSQITCTSAAGGWLRTREQYSDFELRLEYRLESGGNTGIGLRSPPSGNPTFKGIEIQLLDDQSEKYTSLRADQYTGSIYYQVAATKRANLKPVGEWNLCEIRCQGDTLTVMINGEQVNEIQLNRDGRAASESDRPKARYLLSERPPVGHIALQSHSTKVDFRNIVLKDLSVLNKSGLRYVDLVEGNGDATADVKTVVVHYVGQLMDGKRFTDSRDLGEPVKVPFEAVIPGWKEGLQGMKVGGKRRLIVPPQLAYGSAGVGDSVPPDSTLVFEVELFGVEK